MISGPEPCEFRNRDSRRAVFDHSEWPDYNDKARQTTLETHAKIARGFGRHRLAAEFGYTRLAGQKAIGLYNQQLIHAALRYGIEGGVVRLEAGADYYHDKVKTVDAENYIIPFVRLNLNLGTDGLCPFSRWTAVWTTTASAR